MSAYEILHLAESAGLELWVEGETLRFSAPLEPDESLIALLKEYKANLLPLIENRRIPRLPHKLEALVRAASSNHLTCNVTGVHDVNRHVLAWAAGYLTGDRQQALKHLWNVHKFWRRFS